ncbi:MAG: HAD-IB family hydrolase [Gammaproteobacteria bacterium]|nr:HAD-IB family hydrolase [Gammaproteobacteria bacterium]
MGIALFDLDNTLIAGDSDYLWGCFLVEQGIVDGTSYERANRRFYDQYKVGELDIFEFLDFQLRPLAEHDLAQLEHWRAQYIQEKIVPILLPKAHALIDRHRASGDTLAIITATNRFITEPIAGLYGIDHLLATEPQLVAGRYTGKVTGVPCFQDGKIKVLEGWLEDTGLSLDDSWFYSDSHNDLPLLGQVQRPHAVDPDEILEVHARQQGWPVISLR